MQKRPSPTLPVIGWREWAGLPELGITEIKAKVDTGARSSSLHVFDLQEYHRGEELWVRFKVYPVQRSAETVVETEAQVPEYRSVRSSSGRATKRPVIWTAVCLLGSTWKVEVTLANRDEMGFRMLLGREAIRRRFLVDPGRSFLGSSGGHGDVGPKGGSEEKKRNTEPSLQGGT